MNVDTPASDGLKRAWKVFKRRKYWGLIAFLLAFSAVVTIAITLPNLYESRATVIIDRQQIPGELVKSTVTSLLDTRLQMIGQEILSRSRLIEIMDRFGLYEDLRQRAPIEIVAEAMRRDIKIELRGDQSRNSTVAFTVSYRGRDPATIAAVANTIAAYYVDENVKVRGQQASGTSQFLNSQLDEMQRTLEEMENRVSLFKKGHIGELPHQQEANLATLEQLNMRLRLNMDSQIRASERIRELEKQLADAKMGPVAVDEKGRPRPNTTAGQLTELKRRLRELQKQYSDRYPDIIAAKSQIAALEEQLAEEKSSDSSDVPSVAEDPYLMQLEKAHREASTELDVLKAEAQRINGTLSVYQERVENAPLREQQYQVLMRDYDTTKELYRSLLLRQKEAELAENMEEKQKGETFRIVDPALPSRYSVAPDRPRILAFGFALSIGFAIGIVLLKEQLDTSYHDIDELRKLSPVPVLAGVPKIVTAGDKRAATRRAFIGVVSTVAGLLIVVSFSYLIFKDNEGVVALLMR